MKKLAGEMAEQNHLMMPGCPSWDLAMVVFSDRNWVEGFEG